MERNVYSTRGDGEHKIECSILSESSKTMHVTDVLLFEIKVYAHTHTLFGTTLHFSFLFFSFFVVVRFGRLVSYGRSLLFAIAVLCHSIMSEYFVFCVRSNKNAIVYFAYALFIIYANMRMVEQ